MDRWSLCNEKDLFGKDDVNLNMDRQLLLDKRSREGYIMYDTTYDKNLEPKIVASL